MPSGRTPKCALEVVGHHVDLPARVALRQHREHRLVEAAAEQLDLTALDERAQLVEVVGPLALDPLEQRPGVVQRHLHRRELGERVDERPVAVVVRLLEHVPEVSVGLMVVDGEEQGQLAHGRENLCTDGLFGNDDPERRESAEGVP